MKKSIDTIYIYIYIYIIPFMDHSLVMAKGIASPNEAMTHGTQGHPRWMGHSEEF